MLIELLLFKAQSNGSCTSVNILMFTHVKKFLLPIHLNSNCYFLANWFECSSAVIDYLNTLPCVKWKSRSFASRIVPLNVSFMFKTPASDSWIKRWDGGVVHFPVGLRGHLLQDLLNKWKVFCVISCFPREFLSPTSDPVFAYCFLCFPLCCSCVSLIPCKFYCWMRDFLIGKIKILVCLWLSV